MLLTLSSYSTVHLNGKHLTVQDHESGNFPPRTVPLNTVDRVVVSGSATLSTPLLIEFGKRDVPVTYLTRSGKYAGSFNAGVPANMQRQKMQFEYDVSGNIDFAIGIIQTKIKNQARTLKRLQVNHPGTDCKDTIQRLQTLAENCNSCRDLDKLRGVEGTAARKYFAALNLFLPEEWRIKGRVHHPATDPTNALLSFTYSCATSQITGMLYAHGLNPAIGVMHKGISDSLAYDLVEIFRAPVCDVFAMKLINKHILKQGNFVRDTDTGACSLSREGRSIFYTHWEQNLFTVQGQRLSFQNLVDRQVISFIRALDEKTVPDLWLVR